MRRQIRLTGRKQLPRSSVDIRMLSAKHSGKVKSLPVVGLTIVKPQFYDNFPRSARIRLRLIENKFAETLEFGTLGNPRVTVDLEHTAFRVPSCQLRIVASDLGKKGRLLGSTNTWNLSTDDDSAESTQNDAILLFQPQDLGQRAWKLHIRDSDYPVVYVNERVANCRAWAKADPVFLNCVLPEVVRQVFIEIFQNQLHSDQLWAQHWLTWAEDFISGTDLQPITDLTHREIWIDELIESFCKTHKFNEKLLQHLIRDDG